MCQGLTAVDMWYTCTCIHTHVQRGDHCQKGWQVTVIVGLLYLNLILINTSLVVIILWSTCFCVLEYLEIL